MGRILKKFAILFVVLASFSYLISFYSCDGNDGPKPKVKTGKMVFTFDHKVDNAALEIDTMKYVNAAGNKYEISEVQYFISDVTLYKKDGGKEVLNDWTFYHYVDSDIPSSLTWNVVDAIPIGEYTGISFNFGLDSNRNTPYMFANPPEVNMFWPYLLGGDNGGYHYMKINGFWIDTNSYRRSFNFHIGVGQKYTDDIIDINNIEYYIQNSFVIILPNSSFTISENDTTEVQMVMNIENWFQNPNDYNHDDWGGDIMQKQAAMKLVKENGHDVFTVGYIK